MLKKPLLLLLSFLLVVLTLSSCNKLLDYYYEDDEETEIFSRVYDFYIHTQLQSNLSLDPTDVAFRFNMYLQEIENNPVNALGYMDIIFNPYIDLEKSDSVANEYTLTFNEDDSSDEYSDRIGSITINTGGKFLGEVGAVWTLSTSEPYYVTIDTESATNVDEDDDMDEGEEYSPYADTYEEFEVEVSLDNYTITCVDENTWEVNTEGFESVYNYTSLDCTSNWDMIYTITQSSGTQIKEDISDADFVVTAESTSGQATCFDEDETFYYKMKMVYYSNCSYSDPAVGSEVKVILYDGNSPSTQTYDQVLLVRSYNALSASTCGDIWELATGTLYTYW